MRSALWLSTTTPELSTGKKAHALYRPGEIPGPVFLATSASSESTGLIDFMLTSRAGYVKIRPNGAQGLLSAQERLIPSPQDSAPPDMESWQRLRNELPDKSGWA